MEWNYKFIHTLLHILNRAVFRFTIPIQPSQLNFPLPLRKFLEENFSFPHK